MIRFFVAVFVALFLRAQAPVPQPSQQPPPAISEKTYSTEKQRGTEAAPLGVKIANGAEEAQKKANTDTAKKPEGMTQSDKIAIIGGVIAFLQFLALVATVRVMMRSSKEEMRAYVGVKKLSFDIRAAHANAVAINGVFQHFMVAEIQNFGSTPASEVRYIGYITRRAFGQPLEESFDFDGQNDAATIARSGAFTSVFRLSPGESEISKAPIQAAAAMQWLVDARARKASIYFWGRIYYRDIYGRAWRTKFCHVWEPWHPGGQRFVPYSRHNDEDRVAFDCSLN